MKKEYDLIFCVLTYRNETDVIEFLKSLSAIKYTYKVIVVNSFYDVQTASTFLKIAEDNNCDYIEVANKGYGYGNNAGIAYAKENYYFKFLIVCNPDTEIVQMDAIEEYADITAVIAPKIIRNDGRNQNPMRVTEPIIADRIAYTGFKKNISFLVYVSVFFNKIDKILRTGKKRGKIYQGHGSFLIFQYKVLERISPVFDENMFLFCEESDLAKQCKNLDIDIFYEPRVVVKHHEDGSMKLASQNLKRVQAESFVYYFEKWKRKEK